MNRLRGLAFSQLELLSKSQSQRLASIFYRNRQKANMQSRLTSVRDSEPTPPSLH
ncbi:hypothetical protein RRSWK_05949 [Rhodopirellula sp. SWK7]|nr:hypothetical protein RRSWK_05949 [Rhodopirellula sp. SWK7]